MYEYVITKGPGIMLEHGLGDTGDMSDVVATLQDGETLLVAPSDAKPQRERFH